MSSAYSTQQVLQNVHDLTDEALQVRGIGGTFVSEKFDYVQAAYPDSVTEVYTYKLGGASGTTVATLTVVYVDSSKDQISTVTKV